MSKAKKKLPYARKEIKFTLSDKNRFWNSMDKTGGPDSCWLWAGAKFNTGYGKFRTYGKIHLAHRAAWIISQGSIPHDGSYHGSCVCHRCDVHACCNPAHLFLGTQGDNMRDRTAKGRVAHGEDHYMAKLTSAQVLEIRSLYAAGGVSHSRLARQFGLKDKYIASIINGRIWKHLPVSARRMPTQTFSSKLTTTQVIEIRSVHKSGVSYARLAKVFGVHKATIRRTVRHKLWKHVIDPTHPLYGIW